LNGGEWRIVLGAIGLGGNPSAGLGGDVGSDEKTHKERSRGIRGRRNAPIIAVGTK